MFSQNIIKMYDIKYNTRVGNTSFDNLLENHVTPDNQSFEEFLKPKCMIKI